MTNRISDNKFNFFVPIELEKAKDGSGKKLVKIKGICSSMTEDSDGETLDPTGFDFAPLIQKGFLNWNHQASKTSKAICGEPTHASVINNGKDFYIEGFLYDNEEGKAVAELAETLERDSPNRRLGFSIEGAATERDPFNNKKITKAVLNGLAITHVSKNKNTLLSLMKGEYAEAFVKDEDEPTTCTKCDHDQVVNGKCMACNHEEKKEKAITTDVLRPALPESVEHDPKDISNKNSNKFGKLLKKSDIYISITDRYNTTIAESKKIYSFIEEFNTKNFGMENKGTVTSEQLQKAFDTLDSAISLVKAKDTDIISKDADIIVAPVVDVLEKSQASDADVAFAKSQAAFLFKAGYDKEKACDTMTKGGIALVVAQGAYASVVAEASAKRNGSESPEVIGSLSEPPIGKAEQTTALVAETPIDVNDVIRKSVEPITESINKKFEGTSVILKALREQNEELVKSNLLFSERLGKLESTPGVRKSITGAKAVERFEKSGDTNIVPGTEIINIKSKPDLIKLRDLVDAANDEVIRKGGESDPLFEKIINYIEVNNEIPKEAYPRLRAMNIILQQPE